MSGCLNADGSSEFISFHHYCTCTISIYWCTFNFLCNSIILSKINVVNFKFEQCAYNIQHESPHFESCRVGAGLFSCREFREFS